MMLKPASFAMTLSSADRSSLRDTLQTVGCSEVVK